MPLWVTFMGLYVANVIGLFCVAIAGSKRPALTLIWIFVGLLLPFVGIALYFVLLLPVKRRIHQPWERALVSTPNQVMPLKPDLERSTSGGMAQEPAKASRYSQWPASAAIICFGIQRFASEPVPANLRAYHRGDDFYRDLIAAIAEAQVSIDIEFYIFRYDDVGSKVVQALVERAEHNVRIRFLRDGFGSKGFPQAVVRQLQEAGIDCRVHFPLRFPYLTPTSNHRDHSKIVIIDGTIVFTGGMNVGIEYAGRDPSYGPWRDTHVQIVGHVPLPIAELFNANFESARTEIDTPVDVRTSDHLIEKGQPSIQVKGAAGSDSGLVQFLQSGPDTGKQNLRHLFFLCITAAQNEVEITTPYFLPESDLMMALMTAVERGVHVRLLLPEHVDHRLVGYACQTYFLPLLQTGVEIYLYQPGVLHAKVMTVDDSVGIVGAANYDIRSFRLNYEVVMVQYGRPFVDTLRTQFERDLQQSRQLCQADLHQHWLTRAKHQAARLLAPIM